MFDVCPLFSSLQVVLESSRQNHNRPKLFCRYTRLAQARSSSGHENRLSSQVDKRSRLTIVPDCLLVKSDMKKTNSESVTLSVRRLTRSREMKSATSSLLLT